MIGQPLKDGGEILTKGQLAYRQPSNLYHAKPGYSVLKKSVDLDQLASGRNQLIRIYTIFRSACNWMLKT